MGRRKNQPGLVNEILNHLQNGDFQLFSENYFHLSSDDKLTVNEAIDRMAEDEFGKYDPYEADEDERSHYDVDWD